MRVGIHQPMYLPWLGMFDRVQKCDLFILLDNVQYSKNYYLNRNKIKTPNGWIWLTIPILTKGNFGQLIKDAEINNTVDWPKKHFLSICQYYKKAPYLSSYLSFLEKTYNKKWTYLSDLSEFMFMEILRFLSIKTPVKKASDLKTEGKKEELVLNLCKQVGADEYLSGPDGKNYIDTQRWKEEDIKVSFHDYKHPEYSQLHGKFLPCMSIIDLFLNCGPESPNILIN